MKKSFYIYAAAAIILLVGIFSYIELKAPTASPSAVDTHTGLRTVQLNGSDIYVFTADTAALRQKGLGGRTALADDEGMLFVFPQDGVFKFWMKDMLFSIDMLWLTKEGRVIYIADSVSPETYPQDFGPDSPARYVLEVPAGYAKSHDIQIGSVAKL